MSDSLEAQVLKIAKFRYNFELMKVDAVRGEFTNLSDSIFSIATIDWSYLISCASILALSPDDLFKSVALRIASSCMSSTSSTLEHRTGAAVIFGRLANNPSIDLALKRDLITPASLKRIPIMLKIDGLRSTFENSIVTADNQRLHLNPFQKRLYEMNDQSDWLSVSAPTSAGKSFILEYLIEEFLINNPSQNVCYVVPTRALISQVEADLMIRLIAAKLNRVYLSSVPQLPNLWQSRQILLVLTQERLAWLLNDAPREFKFGLVVIDEAQKIGDGHRGIILQRALEEAVDRNLDAKILFASPQTENPEILLRGRPAPKKGERMTSDYVAVNQNLVWIDQLKGYPRKWRIELHDQGQITEIGRFEGPPNPPEGTLRIAYVAASIGGKSGVLIYANTPADAERIAEYLLSNTLVTAPKSQALSRVIKLVKKTVHPEYLLARTLEAGIGFHYGNMPTSLRIELERLFKAGKIRFLICTATLIEGVNLGARSVFLRGPRKGRTLALEQVDFWNLAGRAGRLGSDLQGNIVCVDVSKADVWDREPPTVRSKYYIREASDISEEALEQLVDFVKEGTPRQTAYNKPFLEYALSFYISRLKKFNKIEIPAANSERALALVRELEDGIRGILSKVTLPEEIVDRNIGVSPLALQSLLEYFEGYEKDVSQLIPGNPAERNIAETSYLKLLQRIFSHLSGDYHALAFARAILVVSWMRGLPLSAIIKNNQKYWLKVKKPRLLANVIRDTMEDIEEFARFRFAKYSSSYLDVLRHFFIKGGRRDLCKQIPDLSMWLEFGSSQETQISLMSLGLSRNAAISFSKHLGKETLTREQCADAILSAPLSKIKIAGSVREELERVKEFLMEA